MENRIANVRLDRWIDQNIGFFYYSGMFVDTGNNYSVLDHPNICFVYEYVGSKDEDKSKGDFVSSIIMTILILYKGQGNL